MNIHDLAVHITKREDGEKVLNVGDVKEVLRLLALVFAEEYTEGSRESWENFRQYAMRLTQLVRPDELTKGQNVQSRKKK
jgi:hypothetical protein